MSKLLSIFLLTLTWLNCVIGDVHLAFESNDITFHCQTTVTPIWMEKTKSMIMANGLNKRTTFKNER